ncbi:hypothetical protein DCO58_07045 [Helicobacter saguini]|uniref:MnmC-like methyltransferase domain-containing protein n=1 Tax=Helicobacter saguini TaxID=1548018 RepID=A0A347VWS4_9HELI|nr:MnmC family methyltransferase [Helicobacter saguini]MWV61910.1 hypothetical protein [Helicobacter saguini]MWV67415.1 hypothetical protein [Helicobacter saguini]MWV69768.1 hypothetical protein [Helicobacter saguini]MWV73015.1 hypothetical protein [Helicobacter saguini]TLD95607.1 hypothetical protein LS64_001770 [Helicobacter saguini]
MNESLLNDSINKKLHIVQGADLSLSAYNEKYKQSYHCKSLGAYSESMIKHILPALVFLKYFDSLDSINYNVFIDEITNINTFLDSNKSDDIESNIMKIETLAKKYTEFNNSKIRILDICFGLGFNALLALQHFKNVEIYSPEIDMILPNLLDFNYKNIKNSNIVINELIKNRIYKENEKILYFLHGNALDFIVSFEPNFFNIVFQDAFSKEYNGELWNLSYFQKLYKIMAKNSIITTYAKAKVILENASKSSFKTFKHKHGSIFYKS